MQTRPDGFTAFENSNMRPIAYKVGISFDKIFDNNADFFTIGTSLIGGVDFIKPVDTDIAQEWDKYRYVDYTSKLLKLEVSRQRELFTSVTQAMADVVLDNSDDYFTPNNSNSPINNYLIPQRPIRIWLGFEQLLIAQFIGLTEGMPIIDEQAKTATFHCVDFFSSILNRDITETILLENQTTDEIISTLFTNVGLDTNQFVLDEGENQIGFAFFEKGAKLEQNIKQLVQVENGRIYMDSLGIIFFKNHQNVNTDIVYRLNEYDHITQVTAPTEDNITNVFEIKGEVRQAQENTKAIELTTPYEIGAGESVEVWVNFTDPIITVDQPIYIDSATTSSYTVNTLEDGSGDASEDVTITDTDEFGMAYKMTFQNSGLTTLYITNITIYASLAVVSENIFVRGEDTESVAKYDERVKQIDNKFYQTEGLARYSIKINLESLAEYGGILVIETKGTPALELDDVITVELNSVITSYQVIGIINSIEQPIKFKQTLTLKKYDPLIFFTIGSSQIGGIDKIKPNLN